MAEPMANIGPTMNPPSEVCMITGEVGGTPRPDVRAALDAMTDLPEIAERARKQ
jgi:hypothetical protein